MREAPQVPLRDESMKILGPDSLVFGVDDVEACRHPHDDDHDNGGDEHPESRHAAECNIQPRLVLRMR